MRITMVISSLQAGGAERVLSTMANYWAEKNWEVTLITLDSANKDFYPMKNNIHRVTLGLISKSQSVFHAVKNNMSRMRKLRQAIKFSNPQIVISFMDRTNILVLLATRGLSLPVIISERTDPRMQHIGRINEKLRLILYPRATRIVVQTTNVSRWAIKFLPRYKVLVIPNPISIPIPIRKKRPNGFTILTIGRLSEEKATDVLLKAFALCTSDEYNHWTLNIIGEGPERGKLEELVLHLGLNEKVNFIGSVTNPETHLVNADLFVLSSRYEGFPNVLLEAMSCGLPVISTDCPSGPNEIITHNVNGILVENENVKELASEMKAFMENDEKRIKFGEKAKEIYKKYKVESIMNQWETSMMQILKEK